MSKSRISQDDTLLFAYGVTAGLLMAAVAFLFYLSSAQMDRYDLIQKIGSGEYIIQADPIKPPKTTYSLIKPYRSE